MKETSLVVPLFVEVKISSPLFKQPENESSPVVAPNTASPGVEAPVPPTSEKTGSK